MVRRRSTTPLPDWLASILVPLTLVVVIGIAVVIGYVIKTIIGVLS